MDETNKDEKVQIETNGEFNYNDLIDDIAESKVNYIFLYWD